MTGWLSLLSLVCLLTTLSVMECQSTLRYAHREAAAGLTDIPWQIFCSQADQGYLCALRTLFNGRGILPLASFFSLLSCPFSFILLNTLILRNWIISGLICKHCFTTYLGRCLSTESFLWPFIGIKVHIFLYGVPE